MVEDSGGLLEFPNHVEAPNHERPSDGDRLERLGRQVTPLGVVLTSLVGLDEDLGVGEGSQSVKAMSKSLSHEGAWRYVVPADAAVVVEE